MKIIFVAVAAILLVICSLGYYNFKVNMDISKLESRQDDRLKEALLKDRVLINQDLREKYKEDMDSFESAAKNMEIEKKRAEELESQIKARKGAKK